jgi:hypothetical protein
LSSLKIKEWKAQETIALTVFFIDRESDDIVLAVTREVKVRQLRNLSRTKNNDLSHGKFLIS